jgi:putative transposase
MNYPGLQTGVWKKVLTQGFSPKQGNHVHCLISLGSGQNIDKILMLLKGESSFWINKAKILRKKFEWQDEYFAVSVSQSAVNNVREYIRNQEEHHRKHSFEKEYNEFIKKYGFDKLISG